MQQSDILIIFKTFDTREENSKKNDAERILNFLHIQ